MTQPRALTADQSGIYRTPARIQRVRERADAGDAAWLEADLSGVQSKADLIGKIARAGGFPETFGANWDALADSLQDLSWRPARGYVLHLQSASPSPGADWSMLLEILAQSAEYWKVRGKPFIVLVDAAARLPTFK